jgi:hypothetical protein
MLSATVLLPAALVALLASGSVAAMGDDIKGKLIYSFEDDAQSGD